MGVESRFSKSDRRSTQLFTSWEDVGQEKYFCGICKKMVQVLNYYDKHLCKYAEFFVGFYNQSPGVTITEDTWVIYVPRCPARDGEMIAGQRPSWGQWEAPPDQSEVSPVTLDTSQYFSPSTKWCTLGWETLKVEVHRAYSRRSDGRTYLYEEMKNNFCHFQLIPR